jgi:hypothetical protein
MAGTSLDKPGHDSFGRGSNVCRHDSPATSCGSASATWPEQQQKIVEFKV